MIRNVYVIVEVALYSSPHVTGTWRSKPNLIHHYYYLLCVLIEPNGKGKRPLESSCWRRPATSRPSRVFAVPDLGYLWRLIPSWPIRLTSITVLRWLRAPFKEHQCYHLRLYRWCNLEKLIYLIIHLKSEDYLFKDNEKFTFFSWIPDAACVTLHILNNSIWLVNRKEALCNAPLKVDHQP